MRSFISLALSQLEFNLRWSFLGEDDRLVVLHWLRARRVPRAWLFEVGRPLVIGAQSSPSGLIP